MATLTRPAAQAGTTQERSNALLKLLWAVVLLPWAYYRWQKWAKAKRNRRFNKGATITAAAIFGLVYYFIALALILSPFDGANSNSSSAGSGSSSRSVRASGPSLTGFGATNAEWSASHVADGRFDPGSAYNPNPALSTADDPEHNDEYSGVIHQDGRVLMYNVRILPGNENESAARRQLMREFPSDAVVRWFVRKDTCAQMGVQSRKLGQALSAPSIGDPQGTVLVEFESIAPNVTDTYFPHQVTDAMLSLGTGMSSKSASGC